jgi:hypothetical protein
LVHHYSPYRNGIGGGRLSHGLMHLASERETA